MRALPSCSAPPWPRRPRGRSPPPAPPHVRSAAGRDRPDLSRAFHEAIVECIAGTAHGADRVGGAAAVERLAQAPDMNIDGALVDVDIAAPNTVEQLLAREHATRILHQEFQQTEFSWSKLHIAPGARDALFLAIELDVAGRQHTGDTLRLGSSQQGADACQQLRHGERLDDV